MEGWTGVYDGIGDARASRRDGAGLPQDAIEGENRMFFYFRAIYINYLAGYLSTSYMSLAWMYSPIAKVRGKSHVYVCIYFNQQLKGSSHRYLH